MPRASSRTVATFVGLVALLLVTAAIWFFVFTRSAPGSSAAGPTAPVTSFESPSPTPVEPRQDQTQPAATSSPTVHSTPPPTDQRTVAVFLGGGSVAGLGAGEPAGRWTTLVSAREGWKERNLGHAGAGYLAGGADSAPELVEQAAAKHPEVVVVAPGSVDLQRLAGDGDAVHDAIKETFGGLRAALPEARIVVLAPSYDIAAPPAALATMDRWVRSAARDADAEYVAASAGWLTGRDQDMTSSGTSPAPSGHTRIARQLHKWLASHP